MRYKAAGALGFAAPLSMSPYGGSAAQAADGAPYPARAVRIIVPFALNVHPSLPVQNVRQRVALAKSRPGELNYGSPGAGGIVYLVHALFGQMTGISITRVPYKGTAPAAP